MDVLFDLLLREVAMLGVLSAVGSGISLLLPGDGRVGSRIALVPALGLATCGAVMTTAGWFLPARDAAWVVLLPLAVVSVVVAAWGYTRRRPRPRLERRAALQLGVIAVVVLTALSWPLVARDSVGPIAFQVYDANGYVSEMQAYKDNTISKLADIVGGREASGNGRDLSVLYGAAVDQVHQQVGYSETSAAVNEFFGWRASTSQNGFMSILLVIGAFAAFAAIRTLTDRRSWIPVLGAVLYTGPLFYELFLDGSEAALSGLAILPAFVVVGANLLQRVEPWSVLLLGLLAGGFLGLYPPFVPTLAVAVVLAVAVRLALAWRAKTLGRATLTRGALALAGATATAVVVAPVALYRDLEYWTKFADSAKAYIGAVPRYDLPLQVLPSWLLQTREFYVLNRLGGDQPLSQWLLGAVIPLGLLAIIVFGLVRFRRATVLLALGAAAAALAYFTFLNYDCTYCVQRTLLIVGPVAAIAVAIGIQALWDQRFLWWRVAAVVCAIGVILVVGEKASVGVRRAEAGTYAFPKDLRTIQKQVGRVDGPIYLEAIGQGYEAPIEFPATYEAINESTSQPVGVSLENNDYAGLAYVGAARPPGAEFDPNYRWVMTRTGSIATARQTVARAGPYALQRRTQPLDVAVTSGVAVDTVRDDPKGLAWVQGPMGFWISGPGPKRVWLKLLFAGSGAIHVFKPPGSKILRQTRSATEVCVPVPPSGEPELRRATVELADYPMPPAQPAARELSVRGRPGRLVQLAGMWVSTRDCTR